LRVNDRRQWLPAPSTFEVIKKPGRVSEACGVTRRPASASKGFLSPLFLYPAHTKPREKESYSSDYSKEPKTLVEFRLERTAHGTLLTVTESGFEDIPGDRRLEAFGRNEGGWTEQMEAHRQIGQRKNLIPHPRPAELRAGISRIGRQNPAPAGHTPCGGPYSVSELTGGSKLTRQAITQRLRGLRAVGFVRCKRAGRQQLLEFNPRPFKDMREYLERVSEEMGSDTLAIEGLREKVMWKFMRKDWPSVVPFPIQETDYGFVTSIMLSSTIRSTSLWYGSIPALVGSSSTTISNLLSA
jgi:hypothetical protein